MTIKDFEDLVIYPKSRELRKRFMLLRDKMNLNTIHDLFSRYVLRQDQ